jgi:hypothetical protein
VEKKFGISSAKRMVLKIAQQFIAGSKMSNGKREAREAGDRMLDLRESAVRFADLNCICRLLPSDEIAGLLPVVRFAD